MKWMKKTCPICKGTGREKQVKIDSKGEEIITLITCEFCEGSGVKPNCGKSFYEELHDFSPKAIHIRNKY